MVGPNEAGKTAVLQALQQIRPPAGVPSFDALRDYPRALYNDVSTGKVDPSKVTVATVKFTLEPDDLVELAPGYENAVYEYGRNLDNSAWHQIIGGPVIPRFDVSLSKDLTRMAAHADKKYDDSDGDQRPSAKLKLITDNWTINESITTPQSKQLQAWLNEIVPYVDEADSTEDERHSRLLEIAVIRET